MNKPVIAVCGKGGVGKTTVSAIIAQALARRAGTPCLLVDADPSSGLAVSLGLAPKRTLDDVRLSLLEEIRQGRRDQRDMALSVDYLLHEAIAEHGNLAFLAIGRQTETGCYCAINRLLKQAVELLVEQFAVTVIDAEAGIEQLNRDVMRAVNFLLLVSDTSVKSLRVAATIAEVAATHGGPFRTGLLLNRVRQDAEIEAIAARCALPVLGGIPEDETVRRFDAEAGSFFELPDCPAATAVRNVLAAAVFSQ